MYEQCKNTSTYTDDCAKSNCRILKLFEYSDSVRSG